MRLTLLCCLASVVTPLFVAKNSPPTEPFARRDDIPASSEWAYPIQQDPTGTINITSVFEVSLEEARRLHFPGWDGPELKIALLADDLDNRKAANLKSATTKRDDDVVGIRYPGHANATCRVTGRNTFHPIGIQTAVNTVLKTIRILSSGIHTTHSS